MIPDLDKLADAVHGRLIVPGHPGYDEARTIWNGDIDRRPPAIVRCLEVADAVAAVTFAAERGLPVAVRGGGHGVAGHALCEDGIVVDLSAMREVEVDPQRRIAHVQGGALWADVDVATQRHGLAVTGGIVSHTGVGGLTLGGGIGHLMRRCGLTADNLVEADVVLPDGRLVSVDADSDPDLLIGLRGGGGNFGVVVRFGFRLHEVGPTVLAGMVIHPLDAAPGLLARYRDEVAEAPDALGSIVNLRLCPPLAVVPRELHATPVMAMVLCWSGPIEDGVPVVGALQALGRPILDTVGPMPYQDLNRMVDASSPHGRHYYWRSADFQRLDDDVIDTVVTHAARITSPISAVPIYHLGGAVQRFPQGESSYGSRTAGHNINFFAGWEPGDDRERHVRWVREFSAAMEPHSTGRYVNFLSDEGAAGVRAAYGPRWQHLLALKRRIDPDNLFRYNFNVDPGPLEEATA